MNNIQLPLELIDSIIISNPNTIYTIYAKIIDNITDNKLIKSESKQITKKRKIESNNYILLEYIKNNQLYYFTKSSYLKYFINKINNNTTNNYAINNAINNNAINNNAINYADFNDTININNIAENYILFEKYIHNKLNSDYNDKGDKCDKDEIDTKYVSDIIFNLETYLDNNLSVILLEKYMNNFMKFYKTDSKDIPDFVKLYIILKSCNYFPTNYHHLIYIFNFILEDEEVLFPYNLQPEYKLIPLFRIYLGMGYGFIIGWDMLIDRLIGFIDGGNNGHEVEYNNMMIKKYLSLDKKQRLQKYEHIIGNDINKEHTKIHTKMHKNIQHNMLKHGHNYRQNISKYLALFNNMNQTLINESNPFEYLAEHKLLIF